MGLDFAVMYSTGGSLFAPFLRDEDVRKAACHAFNIFLADTFRDYADRMTPAAVIPMHTPEEALAELDHVKELGLKVVMMSSLIRRPVPDVAKQSARVSALRSVDGHAGSGQRATTTIRCGRNALKSASRRLSIPRCRDTDCIAR